MVARWVGKAEYKASAQGVIEVLWPKSLFTKLGYPCVHTPIIRSDNLTTKSIVENLVFHLYSKHIEIYVHFEIRYVPTSHQVVDIFTKGLPRNRFQSLCDKLSVRIAVTLG